VLGPGPGRYPQTSPSRTIPLPDNVLLEIFNFYLDQDDRVDAWHTLVHVCQQWRRVVFASPRRLKLQLLCTPKRPVSITLKIWPALPIAIAFVVTNKRPRGMANITGSLKQHDRVYKISIRNIPNSLLKIFGAMKKPFSTLTELKLSSRDENALVVPNSFMAGSSTPSLRSLWLVGIPLPPPWKILLSTSDLVDLGLWKIPHSGYITPEAMVTTLSALTRLKKLVLGFKSPRSLNAQARQRLPLPTRVILPALTMLYFKGNSEYLEDVVSRIDAPLLDSVKITFFNQLMLDTPLLRHFVTRTERFQSLHRAQMVFYPFGVEMTLFPQEEISDSGTLKLGISCNPSDWQLSALAQVCNSIIPPLYTLERLGIYEYYDGKLQWQDDMENIQWLDLLRPFVHVTDLVLSQMLVPLVARALQDLAVERIPDVLPVLTNIVSEELQPSGPVKEAIGKFVDARQLSGCPVTVDYKDWV
jgi:F-box-like